MVETCFTKQHVLAHHRRGPLGQYIDGFVTALTAQGYSRRVVIEYLRAAAHLSAWMEKYGIPVSTLDESVLIDFKDHFPACSCAFQKTRVCSNAKWATPLYLRYLRAQGVAPTPAPSGLAPTCSLLDDCYEWMRIHRGLRTSSLETYDGILREFVQTLGDDPAQYDATSLRRFVADRSARNGIATAKTTVTSVRMLLRFAAIHGLCDVRLVDAVQGVASWKLSELPKHVDAQTVERLIASCDTKTEIGLRDRAMLLLLTRLGLRAGDVAELSLEAIDWSAGTLQLRGKGRDFRILPIPQDVGDALLAYLERRQTPSVTGRVFLRMRAPVGPFTDGNAVSCVVNSAARRAGVTMPAWGAHVLRHTTATLLLRQGVPLDCVSGLLRHNSIETTTIYAKVDTTLLDAIAQPWPGEVRV